MRAQDEPQVRHPQAGGPESGGGAGRQLGSPGELEKIPSRKFQMTFSLASAQLLVAAIFYLFSHKERQRL